MDRWHSIADEKIREAMERGDFKNLHGHGKPLRLERNPYEPPELHMAHLVLEGAGLAPAWMDERKDIDRAVDHALTELRTAWPTNPEEAEARFRAAARTLNGRILSYNLQVPAGGFQRLQLDAEWEIRRIQEASQT